METLRDDSYRLNLPKKITRKEQAILTKEKIYTTAIELFNTKGYENVSIADITNAAETARGTFYLYFSSKQDLLFHTIRLYDEITTETYETVKDMSSFKVMLYNYLMMSYEKISRLNREILKALICNYLMTDNSDYLMEQRPLYSSITKITEAAYAKGELDQSVPCSAYIGAIMIFVHGIDYYWCNTLTNEDNLLSFLEPKVSLLVNSFSK